MGGRAQEEPAQGVDFVAEGFTLLIVRSRPGMIDSGYRALEPKKSGMVMACLMPIRRSLLSTMPAMVIDRHEKNAEPRITTAPTPRSLSGFQVRDTPSRAAMRMTTTAWIRDFLRPRRPRRWSVPSAGSR